MTKTNPLTRAARMVQLFAEIDRVQRELEAARGADVALGRKLRTIAAAAWRLAKASIGVELLILEVKREAERLKRERVPKARTVTR